MKIKSSKFSIFITLFATILIITIGYKVLAYAGASFLDNNDEISRLSTDNLTSYVFYSQSEDYVTLYPWTYYYDTISFRDYFGSAAYASDIFDIWELYYNLTFYFYRMVPIEVQNFLYEENITFSDRIDYQNIELDLDVKPVNNELIFYYSKDLTIYNQTYTLNCSFNQKCQILSFQIKSVSDSNLTQSKENMDSAKQFLSDYINASNNNPIFLMYYDIINKIGLYESYLLEDDETEKKSSELFKNKSVTNEWDEKTKESSDYSNYSVDESLKNTSYQLVDADNEFLIIFLENNVVLHFDPSTFMISGFNLSEYYLSQIK